jgi:predicted nucleic acid-binding protein
MAALERHRRAVQWPIRPRLAARRRPCRPVRWQSLAALRLKAILDTSLLIATDVDPLEGELAISAASLAELHFGVLVTADPAVRAERLRRLSLLQRTFDALPVDDDVATSYGQLAAAVAAAGRQPRSRVMDILIAATAHAHAARLYTRNPSDLAGIENLVEIVPA